MAHSKIRKIGALIDDYLKEAFRTEDAYRDAAVMYHLTNREARRDGICPAIVLEKTESAFVLSHSSEYEAIFKPYQDTMAALVDLRSRHVRYSGTVQQLTHRINVDSTPRHQELAAKAIEFHDLIQECQKYAVDLNAINRNQICSAAHGLSWHLERESIR